MSKSMVLFMCLVLFSSAFSGKAYSNAGNSENEKSMVTEFEKSAPNILFIFGDQWRRMALSIYRNNTDYNRGDPVKTPNIDALAKAGVIYDNSYCTAPLCCPNRATLLTGRYTYKHGLINNLHADDFTYDNVTIAHILAEKGYNTGYLGKWHLANHHKNQNVYLNKEQRRGFQYWYGNEMCHHHFDGIFMHCSDEIDTYFDGKLPEKFSPSIDYPDDLKQKEKWMPDHLTRKAIEYLKNTYKVRDVSKPFICYVSYSPPHTIHGSVPNDTANGEESYSIAGKKMVGKNGEMATQNYGKDGRLKGCGFTVSPNSKAAPDEYRAPNVNEAAFREGAKFNGAPIDMGKRPNVSDHYYQHSLTAYPGYFGAVNSLDEKIGEVIETLKNTDDVRNPGHKLIDNTIIVVTSDHGDQIGSHDTMGKSVLYEEATGVPLVFYWKDKIGSNIHKKTIFNSVDMTPTLLGLLGINKSDDMDGSDLSSDLLSKDVGVDDQYAFMRLFKWVAVRHKQYVFAFDPAIGKQCVLFDLEKDPFQLNPILKQDAKSDEQRRMIDHLHAKLTDFLINTNDDLKLPEDV